MTCPGCGAAMRLAKDKDCLICDYCGTMHFPDPNPDGVRVLDARLVDYDEGFTYDILPASDSGTYFAGGALIGSTLVDRPRDITTSGPAAAALRRASIR